MATSVHRVGHLLSAATACGNLVAVTSPDNKVTLYQRSGWQRIAELDGHEDTVTGLDFAAAAEGGGSGSEGASSGLRLVSSSHDRNAYVWTQQAQGGSEWQPEMVITRLTKAGLCVAWAPHGLKFAIGSSERSVDVVSLDAGRELWGPKLIRKKHDSSVMAVAWHPSAALLATAGTDSRLRLFNALVPEVDGRPSLAALGASRFGDCLLETPLPGGWGVATAFSPAGDCLAVASQGSQLTLLTGVDLADPASLNAAAAASGRLQHLQLPGLPLKCLIFLSDRLLAAGGFDYHPHLFVRRSDGQWQYARSLQGMAAASSSSSSAGGRSQAASLSARIKLFEQQAAAASAVSSRAATAAGVGAAGDSGPNASSSSGSGGPEQGGPHKNCIISIAALPSSGGGALAFLTASQEGCIAEWQVDPASLLQ